MPIKILRIAIWANGLMSVLLGLSILIIWTSVPQLLSNSPDKWALPLSIIGFSIIAMPIIGLGILLLSIRREFGQASSKILRITIWLNGLVSALMALMLLAIRISVSYLPIPYLAKAVPPISLSCMTLFPILGISMLVMEILSRRDRSRNSAGDDAQAESS